MSSLIVCLPAWAIANPPPHPVLTQFVPKLLPIPHTLRILVYFMAFLVIFSRSASTPTTSQSEHVWWDVENPAVSSFGWMFKRCQKSSFPRSWFVFADVLRILFMLKIRKCSRTNFERFLGFFNNAWIPLINISKTWGPIC